MGRDKGRVAVSGALRRLHVARREFGQRPAFARWYAEDALYLPDLHAELAAAGVDPAPLSRTIQEAEEAAEYAREALEYRAWDAAANDLNRAIDALARVDAAFGPPMRVRVPPIRRHTTFRFLRGLFGLVVSRASGPYPAWRRLDAALSAVARARGEAKLDHALWTIGTFAEPNRLRPFVGQAVENASRETRARVIGLLDEAEEAWDYATAALDQSVRAAALADLDRLDAALRAMRHIVQRESSTYLPEPWPLRVPFRVAAQRAMRREASAPARDVEAPATP